MGPSGATSSGAIGPRAQFITVLQSLLYKQISNEFIAIDKNRLSQAQYMYLLGTKADWLIGTVSVGDSCLDDLFHIN